MGAVTFDRSIDRQRLCAILQQANILEFEYQGVQTMVAEGRIKLIGGKRQHIAIACALYGNPEILVLKEATSALNVQTEAKIMEEIYTICKNKTLMVIAHRLSTIEKCHKIITLKSNSKPIGYSL
jgi:ABC-type multidrug transport system fused ATPase/permease subunit